jgi:hypothetical protein
MGAQRPLKASRQQSGAGRHPSVQNNAGILRDFWDLKAVHIAPQGCSWLWVALETLQYCSQSLMPWCQECELLVSPRLSTSGTQWDASPCRPHASVPAVWPNLESTHCPVGCWRSVYWVWRHPCHATCGIPSVRWAKGVKILLRGGPTPLIKSTPLLHPPFRGRTPRLRISADGSLIVRPPASPARHQGTGEWGGSG